MQLYACSHCKAHYNAKYDREDGLCPSCVSGADACNYCGNVPMTPTGRTPTEPNMQSTTPHTEIGDHVRAALSARYDEIMLAYGWEPARDAMLAELDIVQREVKQQKTEAEADQLYHACAAIDWLVGRVPTSTDHLNASFTERLALLHADLSAVLLERLDGASIQALRRPDNDEGVPMKLATVITGLLDVCRAFEIPIGEALHEKLLPTESTCRCGAVREGPDLPRGGSMVSPTIGTHYSRTCARRNACDPRIGPGAVYIMPKKAD